MKSIISKLWSIWTGSTEVRHAGTALVATLLVAAAPALTDWASASEQKWATVIVVSALAALTRWAQIKLESLKKPNEPQDPAA